MTMKITKKILAGSLAVVSAFTAASAEPVKVEKPTDSFISTKEDKKPNRESIWKKVAKGAAITAGVTATAVAAVAIGGVTALNRYISDSGLLEVSHKVVEWFLDPEVRECVERYKYTGLGKALKYLFDVLEGRVVCDENKLFFLQNLGENMVYVCRYVKDFGCKSGCDELDNVLNRHDEKTGHCTIKCLTPYERLESYLPSNDKDKYSICINSMSGFSEFKSEYKEKFMQIRSLTSNSVYELKAIIFDVKLFDFLSGTCVKQKNGEWRKYLFGGNKTLKTIDDDSIIPETISWCRKMGKVNLLYVKKC